jgi:5-(carboxyamino)imidazole ribonucleotide synthase
MKGEVRLGILGGGQLGRMLIQAGLDFNLYTLVLDPDENAPCKDVCHEFYVGSFRDFDTVYEFGKNCDVVTIEIEHVNADALEKLEQEGVKVYPDARTVRTIQDKGLQKALIFGYWKMQASSLPILIFCLPSKSCGARAMMAGA